MHPMDEPDPHPNSQIVTCKVCGGSGWQLDERDTETVPVECAGCEGLGEVEEPR